MHTQHSEKTFPNRRKFFFDNLLKLHIYGKGWIVDVIIYFNFLLIIFNVIFIDMQLLYTDLTI